MYHLFRLFQKNHHYQLHQKFPMNPMNRLCQKYHAFQKFLMYQKYHHYRMYHSHHQLLLNQKFQMNHYFP
jgi:hypothetical protein